MSDRVTRPTGDAGGTSDQESDSRDQGADRGEGSGRRRRRGSRGGRRQTANTQATASPSADPQGTASQRIDSQATASPSADSPPADPHADSPVESQAPPPPPRPRIGDTRPAPKVGDTRPSPSPRQPSPPLGLPARPAADSEATSDASGGGTAAKRRRRRGGRGRGKSSSGAPGAPGRPALEPAAPDEAVTDSGEAAEAEAGVEEQRRRGRERRGRPVGRYLMCVHVRPHAAQVAVLEGRSLIEHYVSRPQDEATEIDGNIYLGKVQNVLPGMEAAFIDIGTPKNAVLYRGDVHYDRDDVEGDGAETEAQGTRIEQILRQGQTIICQVTKNPIGTKGARLTQEVSLPGRFVVLIPNSSTYGISKRLNDDERKRLRRILDDLRPAGHGLIVRTAAEGSTAAELRRDVDLLVRKWTEIDTEARRAAAPTLLYAEPDMAVRVIREEFNGDYRGVVIDDQRLFEEVRDYVASISPDLADRVEWYDTEGDRLPLFERNHVHEQLHKALDRKVWLPSGGSIIIERTEALTVIDVNTGKNVGTSNLEETVFRNNCEAAEEIARQLRLRDIGGIIVIDFIDMDVRSNREGVMKVFREALARDKTRTQVFDMSELGLVQMTRKRVSEGLVESFSQECPACQGRGIIFDESLL